MDEKELIHQMREWIADCQWQDLDSDSISDLSDKEIIDGISRNYSGGVEQFVSDCSPVKSSYTAPEPPSHSPNWNEDPFVPRNPADIQDGEYNRPEPEDALNKDRPRGAPSKISALIRYFLRK